MVLIKLERSGSLFPNSDVAQIHVCLIFSCWSSRSISFINVKVIVVSHHFSAVIVNAIVFVFKFVQLIS